MNPEDQVIADIDAFIDEQLAAGEPDNGYAPRGWAAAAAPAIAYPADVGC